MKLMNLALEATDGARVDSPAFAAGGDSPVFPSRMLFTLLAYSYARGVYSSQDIEEGSRRLADFRYLCAGDHPDTATLRRFRRLHWTELHGVLARLLQLGSGDTETVPSPAVETEAESRLVRAVRIDSLSME